MFEVVFGVGPTAADIQRSEMILVANDLLETTAETLIRKLASSVRMEDRDSWQTRDRRLQAEPEKGGMRKAHQWDLDGISQLMKN